MTATVAVDNDGQNRPVPVRLRVEMDGRVAEAIEIAAYYVACESLVPAVVAKPGVPLATADMVGVVAGDCSPGRARRPIGPGGAVSPSGPSASCMCIAARPRGYAVADETAGVRGGR